ncbi:putative ATP-dependent RNA helicase ucp12 [Microbotryomycetes sp. JL221]|nr:putative ATP-dependent RNA helicase ucp12 [Microbotryomycetes sp. JL221]
MALKGSNKSSSKPKQENTAPESQASTKPKGSSRRANIVKSGNAGSSKPVPVSLKDGELPRPPPLFPVGFKTPMSLLSERCQKSNWDRPSVEPKKLPSGKFSAAVILHRKNPKSKEPESVYMRPPASPSPQAVEKDTAMEAKHYAAVYAMFRFSNNLRLHMQLPPGPRGKSELATRVQAGANFARVGTEYWQLLEKEKAASPANKAYLWSLTPFETAATAPPPPAPTGNSNSDNNQAGTSGTATPASSLNGSLQASRASTPNNPHPLPRAWQEAPEVRMPSALRDLVEETIRNLGSFAPEAFDEEDLALSEVELRALQGLVDEGFRRGHVLSAIQHVRQGDAPEQNGNSFIHFRERLLSYLHLHVPEDDLPSYFRHSKPADATARIATSKDSDALGRLWKAEKVAKDFGVPVNFVEDVMQLEAVNGEEGRAIDVLIRKLNGWTQGAGQGPAELSEDSLVECWTTEAGIFEADAPELESRRSDELLGLEGVFGEKFQRSNDGFDIALSDGPQEQAFLRVLLHESSRYPSPQTSTIHIPTFFVHSPSLPPYIRLHLTRLVAEQLLRDDWLDLARAGYGGLIGEMVAYLQEHLAYHIDHPPEPRHVMRYLAPTRMSMASQTSLETSAETARPQQQGRVRRRPAATEADHKALLQHWTLTSAKKGFEDMVSVRRKLPAWNMQQQIVQLVKDNRVVIVSGETGSGKTTQVPRFIFEDAILHGQGASVNIVVTQPRRVSAIGVASRVAAEMLEDVNLQQTRKLVGYAIRGERKASKDCRMLFCTTGVVLSRLSRGGDPDLQGVSHIFIDEVHERSVDSDFLLLELRDILKRNPNIKVILMSATINQKQFSDYFDGAAGIEIPGFTHPVQDFYLEDFVTRLGGYSPSGLRPSTRASQGELDEMRETFVTRGVIDERALSQLELLSRADRIDFDLVGATVAHCLTESRIEGGDVLVFMTGALEIRQAVDAIENACRGQHQVEVLPLHANLTSQEQTRVFKPVSLGRRKVVVATNVAETSITIDGIVYVVDSGRVKENKFDPDTSITRLVECWTNKASARQRRGRAGRTRPGKCYKLYTHWTENRFMADHPTPEMMRTPLESLCLQIKSVRADEDVKRFLSKALSPPDVRAVDSAWATLRLLGAVEEGSMSARLTPLGMHLAMIPVDLRLGKILTIAALLSSKPLFLNPMDKRDEAKAAHARYYTSRSDLLSDVKAFQACVEARKSGMSSLRAFAEGNFISLSTFRDVVQLKYEYRNALSDVGLVSGREDATDNVNSMNDNLLKALVFAGTGRLVKVKLPQATYDMGSSGAIQRDRDAKEVRFFEETGRVFLHPTSLLFAETRFQTPFVTYFAKQVTSKPFLRDATEVPLYGVLLFGSGRVSIDLNRGVIVGNIMMRAWPRIGVLVNGLRRLLDQDLEQRIENPQRGELAVINAMLQLLDRDGGLS